MYTSHPYLQAFIKVLMREPIRVPVVTSAKEHVSTRYASPHVLTEEVSRKELDVDSLISNLSRRIKRPLSEDEKIHISEGVWRLLEEWASVATMEDSSNFAKKFLQKLNDVVVPPLLRSEGLTFDFQTHKTLWSFGEHWKLWQSTVWHPDWDLRIVFATAMVQLSPGGEKVIKLVFGSGLEKIRDHFLEKLFIAYQKLQEKGHGTFAEVDELRAIFCYDNRCQESVFDRLVSEQYGGSDDYELNMEIFRESGRHNRPIRIGTRNIGLIRVVRRNGA
jgi:hypothetical protein